MELANPNISNSSRKTTRSLKRREDYYDNRDRTEVEIVAYLNEKSGNWPHLTALLAEA